VTPRTLAEAASESNFVESDERAAAYKEKVRPVLDLDIAWFGCWRPPRGTLRAALENLEQALRHAFAENVARMETSFPGGGLVSIS